VISIRDERDDEPSWKVRCSIESEAFVAARQLNPSDADLVEYFLNRVEGSIAEYTAHPRSETYQDLFVGMDEYPLWERHLRDRRR
jgi:hypothetical protein